MSANAVDASKKTQLLEYLKDYSGAGSTDNTNINRDSLEWKVLDVKDGQIRLISAVPTTTTIKIFGHNGYNNLVYLLDETCNVLYSSNKATSQNLKIEDIEEKIDKTKFDYTQCVNTSVTPNLRYGETKEYTSSLNYPLIYKDEIGCKAIATTDNTGNTLELSEQSILIDGKDAAKSRLKVTQTQWGKTMETTDFINSKYYTLFIKINNVNYPEYCLSSRYVFCNPYRAGFGVRIVGNSAVSSSGIMGSNNWEGDYTCSFRPVVILDLNIQLEADGTDTWKIKG